MFATTPPTSDGLSNDSTQPEEPPRVHNIYSYANKSPNIRLIQSAATADVAISQLKTKVLGFGLEWRPNFTKGNPENPVALVQLASKDTILLIHVSFMQVFLQRLLLDPTVVKAGEGKQKDCKKQQNIGTLLLRPLRHRTSGSYVEVPKVFQTLTVSLAGIDYMKLETLRHIYVENLGNWASAGFT